MSYFHFHSVVPNKFYLHYLICNVIFDNRIFYGNLLVVNLITNADADRFFTDLKDFALKLSKGGSRFALQYAEFLSTNRKSKMCSNLMQME